MRSAIWVASALAAICLLGSRPANADPATCESKPKASINPQRQDVTEGTWAGNVFTPTIVDLNGSPSKGDSFVWSQPAGQNITLDVQNPQQPEHVHFNAPDVPPGGLTLRFTLTAIGCPGKSDSVEVVVNVSDVSINRAPTATASASPNSVNGGAVFTLNGSASSDPDGDRLTYAWDQLVSGAWQPISTQAVVNLTAPQITDPNGLRLTYRLTVSDGSLTAVAEQIVNVVWVNSAPNASAVCTSPVGEKLDDAIEFDGLLSSDVDQGDVLTFEWTQLEGGPTLNFGRDASTYSSFFTNSPALEAGKSDTMRFNLKVTDKGGLSSSAQCSVRLLDRTPPVLSILGNTTEATGPTTVVNFAVTATDLYDNSVIKDGITNLPVEPADFVQCTPASGSPFPVGITSLTCSAHDVAGNSRSTPFTVTVTDRTPPSLTVPGAITEQATNGNGATVTFTATATDLVDGAFPAVCTPSSGSIFPLTTTTVRCSATDAQGNEAVAQTFTVTVVDTRPPVLTLPSAITEEATSRNGATVEFSATAIDAVDGEVPAVCTPESGSTFPIGTTTVLCNASDRHDNHAETQAFTVTVQDTRPPVLALPEPITAEATGPSGAVVEYTATASDLVDGEFPAVCTPASRSTFPLGTTTVRCNAIDSHNNFADEQTFTVTVQDTTPPVLSLPESFSREATGPDGTLVTFATTARDVVDGAVPVDCTPASGTTFALGTTTVQCTAADVRGNNAEGTFEVTVVDTTPPTLTLPDPITQEATGPDGAAVDFTATASDLIDGDVATVCTPASGTTFALGTTTVQCSAADARGNGDRKTFTVTVRDTTPPTLTLPEPVTREAAGPNGAEVSFAATALDVVDGAVLVNCTPATGSTFALGSTTVQCNATDTHGNTGRSTFTVTVVDTRPPVLTVPAPITQEATGPDGAKVAFTATATDIVDGNVTPVCTPASGSTFPLGTTTVQCSAADAHGNSDGRSFTVTVQDTTPPAFTLGDYALEAQSRSGAAVTWPAIAAHDLVDGDVTATCSSSGGLTSGSMFPIGITTIDCTATDAHGNRGSGSFKVNVSPYFAGFYQPIDNLPVQNSVKGGSTVPVKWSLFGASAPIGDLNVVRFTAYAVACNNAPTSDDVAVTTGGTALRYDLAANQYILNWQTPKTTGCIRLDLQMTYPGYPNVVSKSAMFKLK